MLVKFSTLLACLREQVILFLIGEITRRDSQNDRNRNVLESNFLLFDGQVEKGTCTVTAPCADTQMQDEKVLKDTECSKLKCGLSATRLSIPSLKTITKKCSSPKVSKKSIKVDTKPDSCCSMCCNDKCDR